MCRGLWVLPLALLAGLASAQAPAAAPTLPLVSEVIYEKTVLKGFEFDVEVTLAWGPGTSPPEGAQLFCRAFPEGLQAEASISEGEPVLDEETGAFLTSTSCGPVEVGDTGMATVVVQFSYTPDFAGDVSEGDIRVRVIRGGVTILPPIVAVILAITTREVLLALFCGVWMAAFLIHSYDPFRGFLRTLDTYILGAFADEDHIYIILFSWFLSGLTGLIQRSGGGQGLADAIMRFAKTRRSTMFVCFLCGLAIFFDDYSNSLIIGSTFRPVMDAIFVSREKLAFLVDATSAPVASISPISSWIGFELSLIQEAYDTLIGEGYDLAGQGWETSPFLVFVKTIPGRFYPIAMLALQGFLVFMQRDLGPMFRAERRAIREGKVFSDSADPEQTVIKEELQSKDDVPARWWNAVAPIVLLIFLVLLALILTGVDSVEADGMSKSVENIFGAGSSYQALLWSTFFVSIVTWIFLRLQYHEGGVLVPFWRKSKAARPLMGLRESQDTWVEGIKQLVSTTLVLLLAWAIGDSMEALGTDVFIASGVSGGVDARGIPVLVFILSAAISLATGTSWGTMAIMFPIATRSIYLAAPGDEDLMLSTIASILAGSVFGDHITPISDTTILSALATRCDLMHHVKTQAPYAILVAMCSIFFGDFLSGYAYPMWAGLILTVATTLAAGYLLSARPSAEGDREDLVSGLWDRCAHAVGLLRARLPGPLSRKRAAADGGGSSWPSDGEDGSPVPGDVATSKATAAADEPDPEGKPAVEPRPPLAPP